MKFCMVYFQIGDIMKKIICVFLIFVMLFSLSISVSAEPVLERLENPFDKYLVAYPDETVGRSIWDMTVFNGKLYVGWGDYGNNLGAKLGGMPLVRYTDATNSWQFEAMLDDEQIARFFEYGNKLYITGTDPIKGIGNIYIGDREGSWERIKTFDDGIHVFDMLMEDGITYLSYGQGNASKAVIRYSADQKTYNDIEFRYNGNPVIPKGSGFARSYNIFSFGGNVYATLKFSNSTDEYDGIYKLDKKNMTFNYVTKGIKYLIVNTLAPSFDGEFKGKYFHAYDTLSYTSNVEDDKYWKTMINISGSVTCAKVIDDSLYIMAYTKSGSKYKNTLYKTKDFETVETVYSFEYDAFVQSFCCANNTFYFGTGSYGNASNLAAGTVFSLGTKKTEKTDIVIKTDFDELNEEEKPQWLKYRLKVGDTVVEEGSFNKIYGWETTFEDFDARDDWSVEVIEDSIGHEWVVENTDGVFVVKKKTEEVIADDKKPNMVWVLTVGVILVGGIVAAVPIIVRKKKNKSNETKDKTE